MLEIECRPPRPADNLFFPPFEPEMVGIGGGAEGAVFKSGRERLPNAGSASSAAALRVAAFGWGTDHAGRAMSMNDAESGKTSDPTPLPAVSCEAALCLRRWWNLCRIVLSGSTSGGWSTTGLVLLDGLTMDAAVGATVLARGRGKALAPVVWDVSTALMDRSR